MRRTSTCIVTLLALSAPAMSQVPDDIVRAELLPGWRGENGVHHAGVLLSLRPGWKTYWRAPGDAGIPPAFDLSGSSNVTGADVQFPVPKLFDQAGVTSIGYSDAVIFPVHIRVADKGAPVALQMSVDLGVCEEICVPINVALAGVLPPGGSADARLAAAMESRPQVGAAMDCEVSPISDGLALQVKGAGMGDHVVIEAGVPGIWVSEPVPVSGGVRVDMVPPEGAPFALDRSRIRVSVFDDGEMFETVGCN